MGNRNRVLYLILSVNGRNCREHDIREYIEVKHLSSGILDGLKLT